MNNNDRLLTAEQLANFLDVPIKTLYAWRYRGEGPIGFRVGRYIRYRWVDVEVWIDDRITHSCRSRRDTHRGTAHRALTTNRDRFRQCRSLVCACIRQCSHRTLHPPPVSVHSGRQTPVQRCLWSPPYTPCH